ncbi:hypothetical protein lerEdw1_016929 [Lerista edwardsae]|nr:hypothetical protein lerEdw1_016929 [Lerista edwardsae]
MAKSAGMASQFRSYVWDPVLILSQIVLLQAIYYSSLGLWLALVDSLVQSSPFLDQIFSYEVWRSSLSRGGNPGASLSLNMIQIAYPTSSHKREGVEDRIEGMGKDGEKQGLTIAGNIRLHRDQILGFSTSTGRLSMMAFVLNALTCAVGLLYFIRRGKQCLDFTVTVHFFHLLGCWIYNAHFPTALTWWLVHTVCTALMTVIGEYLCMRTELKEIPLNSAPKSNV